MNLEDFSSRLRLDINHLQWQTQLKGLDHREYLARFRGLVNQYREMTNEQNLEEVEPVLREFERVYGH